jgi:dTDP-4-amino-4,6-dideoxy-D-galactose acyltransferase
MNIETLHWDSNFFSKKIGKIDCSNEIFNYQQIWQLLESAKKDKYELVYIFGDKEFIIDQEVLSNFDGRLVDKKVVYKTNFDVNIFNSTDVSIYNSLILDESILNLAYRSGEYSRFLLDPNFEKDDFRNLYKTWILNSINKQIADEVFVVKFQSSIVGMATLKLKNDSGDIGLIAVDESVQGKGVGTQLISAIKNYLSQRNINCLEVATQLNNTKACAFYNKCGFTVKSINNIYHFWL